MNISVRHFDADGKAPHICAVSAVNGLGFSSYQTWAFRRADITAFASTPFICHNGNRATMAQVQTLPPRSQGVDRLLATANQALWPILELLGAAKGARVALVLGVGSRYDAPTTPRRRELARLEQGLLETIRDVVPEAGSFMVPKGHASVGYALQEACESLARGSLDVAIVGGVDTYYDTGIVQTLIEQERIFDGENKDAFVAGEGAAFMLLCQRSIARQVGWPVRGRIESVSTGSEPANLTNDLPCMATGLTRTCRAISDRLAKEKRRLDWWISDMTGEDYRVHEFQQAWPRACFDIMDETGTLEHLPQNVGDLGAATIATGVAVAIEGFGRGDPNARTCLLTGSSETEHRAAVLVAAP
ncbi:MAG: beta-ketoacyl synthase N-terminal-like domain-containing protein [Myxococcota bacterium]